MNRRIFLNLLGLGWLASISPAVIASTIAQSKSTFKSKQIIFYVSPNGNDNWTGIKPKLQGKNGPFATISKAQQAIRQLKQKQGGILKQPVTISLRGGTHFLKQPLSFTELDAGTDSFPIAYKAYKQEKPVISGGRIIKGWKTTKINGKTVWTTTIPEVKTGKWDFHQLWVKGDRRQRCRYPKKGYLKVDQLPDITSELEWQKGQTRFQFRPGDLKAWQDTDRGEAIVMTRWVESRLPIAGIDEANRIISFRNRSTYRIDPGNSSSPAAGVYYLENVRAFLSDPGEWFLDNKSGQLYYLPLPGEKIDRIQIIAPVLSKIVDFNANWQKGKFVEYLSFENLTFAHAEWYFTKDFKASWPSADVRGFGQAAYQLPGAIYAIGTRRCIWKKCTIAHISNYGIDFADSSFNNQVIDCQFFDLGAGAVKIANNGGNKISGCHIYNGGLIFHSAVAIWIGDAANNLVSRNHIHDFYYSGISVGWTWGYQENSATGNIIEYNHIHHIGTRSTGEGPLLNDKGAIYTLGIQPGTTIHSNLIHDVQAYNYGAWGIYLDEGSSQITIEKNVIYNTRDGAFHLHYGRDNIIRNNIFAFGKLAQLQRSVKEEKPYQSFTLERNIIYWHDGQLLGGKWEDMNYVFDRNLYWHLGKKEISFAKWSWQEWQQQGMDKDSIFADPLFIDAEQGDFRFKPNSPAVKLQFESIDLASVRQQYDTLP
jgi:parallel beta-helix repeat protein